MNEATRRAEYTVEYESELHAQGWPVSPQTKWPLAVQYPRSLARYSTLKYKIKRELKWKEASDT